MGAATYRITVQAENQLAAQQATRRLADGLREIPGVLNLTRLKEDADTMDLGAIVEVVFTSSATLAVARGVADWLRRTRGVHLTILKEQKSGSIRAEVENITADAALRITEKILEM